MKFLYVKAAKGKPLSLSGPGDVELTIKQVMIDKDIPCEVKDCDFIRGCMTKKNLLLIQDTSENGQKKWKAYISAKNKIDAEREKDRKEARVAKLKAREAAKVEAKKPQPKKVKPAEPDKQEAKE